MFDVDIQSLQQQAKTSKNEDDIYHWLYRFFGCINWPLIDPNFPIFQGAVKDSAAGLRYAKYFHEMWSTQQSIRFKQ